MLSKWTSNTYAHVIAIFTASRWVTGWWVDNSHLTMTINRIESIHNQMHQTLIIKQIYQTRHLNIERWQSILTILLHRFWAINRKANWESPSETYNDTFKLRLSIWDSRLVGKQVFCIRISFTISITGFLFDTTVIVVRLPHIVRRNQGYWRDVASCNHYMTCIHHKRVIWTQWARELQFLRDFYRPTGNLHQKNWSVNIGRITVYP